MRRLMGILLIVILALTACNSELAITKLKSVPNDVQKALEQLDQLGMDSYVEKINVVDKDISYIVINTKGTVTVSVESNDDTVSVYIEEEEGKNDVIEEHIYKLTTDRDYEYFQLYKNGVEISIDIVTGI